MTCKRYHFTMCDHELWAFDWSPLPGGDDLHCLAALLSMFVPHHVPRARA